ncbi:Glutamate decarboxylase 2 [Frankliniella fusca]|uniref:Glutamate decarboxylase 2 n=1 Tax=Frankliniella fusca TaxID=407009 RepID=A0AAE1H3U6_9NEOP|nr:Glutamate decarboxylase 2 [Frankliniella fusca]
MVKSVKDVAFACEKIMFKGRPKLLKTPLTYNVKTVVHPGHYWHRGIIEPLHDFVSKTNCDEVLVSFSIDRLPLARSTSNAFWPILCSFNNSPNVVVVGVYYGKDKLANCNEFLNDFVQEISPLCADGLEYNGKIVKVRVCCAVCDAPAKSFVLNTKGHNSYNGYSKCTVKGNYIDHTMSFPCLDAPLRSDESFKAREQTHHHNGHTFNDIPYFGPVSNVPLDSLHLTLLGVVRKTMYAWMSGPYKNRLSKRLIQEVSDLFILLSAWTPSEFARRPRSLKYIKRFKATKYRQILLYTVIVAFSRSIREDLFDHFV